MDFVLDVLHGVTLVLTLAVAGGMFGFGVGLGLATANRLVNVGQLLIIKIDRSQPP